MINIAELLKDAPKGMKLYSPLFGEVEYCYIGGTNRRIWVCTKASMRMFSKDGRYCFTHDGNTIESTECLLFPSKDCRTWEGWKAPVKPNFKVGDWIIDGTCRVKITDIDNTYYWYSKNCIIGEIESIDKKYHIWSIEDAKDGDVLVCYSEVKGNSIEQAGIFKQYVGRHGGCSNTFLAHTGIDWDGNIIINGYMGSTNILPATEEQCDLLFKKMNEAGYEWDEKKKELRKTIEPKFKVGDDIKTGYTIDTIAEIDHATRRYYCESGRTISFENQDLWHFVPKKHYAVANFHVGMPVLVRSDNDCSWDYSVFSRNTGNEYWPFAVCNGVSFTQCIPFNEETKHLLGTTDMPSEEYINW